MSVRVDERPWGAETCSLADPPTEEERWLTLARSGDEAGYRGLLEQYRERAVRLAAHVLRSSSEAEDVAQEAFIRAFRNLRSFRGESRFYTWLYHIVVRVCLDRRKRAWWQREVQPDLSRAEEWAVFTGATDNRVLVEALLDRLTPPMRAALVLRELEGLAYEEIAVVLEIPVGTVRSRLNSARAQFRTLWEAARRETENV